MFSPPPGLCQASGFVLLIRPEPTWLWARALCVLAGKGLGAGGEASGSEAPWQSVFRLLLLPEARPSSSASFCLRFSASVSLCETWISCFRLRWQLAKIPVRLDGRRGLWEAKCAAQMSIIPQDYVRYLALGSDTGISAG